MDFELERKFKLIQEHFAEDLGEEPDIQTLIFLVGVQELGQGYKAFSKEDKMNLMHIAVCTLLEPYGYYTFIGKDEEGWPHFENTDKLPRLNVREQQHLMKEALVAYFEDLELITEE